MDEQECLVFHYVPYLRMLVTANIFIRKKVRKGERMLERYKEKKTERMGEKLVERKEKE